MRRKDLVYMAAAGMWLAAGAASAAPLNDYEGFDYNQTAMHGLNGGTGWGGAWDDANGNYATSLTNDGISLDSPSFPFDPAGSRLSVGSGEGIRTVATDSRIATNVEGNALYLSFLMRKTNTDTLSGDYMEVALRVSSGTRQFRVGISEDDQFYIGSEATRYLTKVGTAVKDETYYVVIKFLTHASPTADGITANVYGQEDTVPLTEPTTWMLTLNQAYNSAPNNLRVETGGTATPLFAEFDEFRIGNAWAGTVVPEPTVMGLLALSGLILSRRRRAV